MGETRRQGGARYRIEVRAAAGGDELETVGMDELRVSEVSTGALPLRATCRRDSVLAVLTIEVNPDRQ
jgi:hypothetical protein